MCGIAGVIGRTDEALIRAMTGALEHRGPEGCGYARWGDAHLGATRLGIMDPSAGPDLISDERSRLRLAFNGEIYNHRSLRAYLRSRGHEFATATDTEVIIHLYEEVGDECVRYLQGMFAFAVIEPNRVFLARDRLGIKPLYYTLIAATGLFIFASEIKAILKCAEYSPRLDLQAFADFVVLSHPVGTDTFFQDVKSLAPGHTLSVAFEPGRVTVGRQECYWRGSVSRDETLDIHAAEAAVADALRAAVQSHLSADVQVGLTLSGGIDSTLLALFARELGTDPLLTFTIGDDVDHPDVRQAAYVADAIKADHVPHIVSFEEYIEAIPGFVAAEERPSRLHGVPFYMLSQHVGRHVKAVVHGEGADELFGGYQDYVDPTYRLRNASRKLPILKRLGIGPSQRLTEILERLAAAGDADEAVEATFQVNLAEPLQRHHLDPVDKCAMAYGVEVRVPYLDDPLVQLVRQLPLGFLVRRDLGVRKYLLRRLCLERFGDRFLDIVLRGKMGVPSATGSLLARLDQLCEEMLPPTYLADHQLGYCFESKRQLLGFELFEDIFFRRRGNVATSGGLVDFLRSRAGRRAEPIL
ncbi:MAG: asparagine synthase (glutamine-hydrolyzing) [Chloroflexota bacterium]|nr:asparagine synthase (glutamine-hydrolyzing) [Chloroflexota bacterium]